MNLNFDKDWCLQASSEEDSVVRSMSPALFEMLAESRNIIGVSIQEMLKGVAHRTSDGEAAIALQLASRSITDLQNKLTKAIGDRETEFIKHSNTEQKLKLLWEIQKKFVQLVQNYKFADSNKCFLLRDAADVLLEEHIQVVSKLVPSINNEVSSL